MPAATRGDGRPRRLPTISLDGYAIVGAPGYCADRLTELSELGVTKFGVIGADFVSRTPGARAATARFTDDVLPRLRG